MPSSPEIAVPTRRLFLPGAPGRIRAGAVSAARTAGPAEVAALVLLSLLIVAAIVGPMLSPYSGIIPSGAAHRPPLSAGHLLGTDDLGLDIGTRVLLGTRTSLFAALVVTALSAFAGLVIGTLAGFAGGVLDNVLMRVTDLFLALPATIVAMAIAAGLGPGLGSSMIGIAVVWWPRYAGPPVRCTSRRPGSAVRKGCGWSSAMSCPACCPPSRSPRASTSVASS